ncbi:DUF1643 domain-containing protein [Virgibacillus sp. C22-A2]|uniref:DUF1643 domain-containing protein n=1 Tax=Virgibacillus tibetensis TaxID=3042313 RepID=A0ABU6KLC4_9BACI|nr:DUF1643 domain-containing protein [Virgibacillus sp. C22-A2]
MTVYKWKENELVDAVFDEEKNNRYLLTCTWDSSKPSVTFIMINPSVGRVEVADATLRKCADFSKHWGKGSMKVVNLYSQVTAYPSELRTPTNEENNENNIYVKKAIAEADCAIFAWGELKREHRERANEVICLVPEEKQFCIKKNVNGQFPRHPLFLRGDLEPIRWVEM